VVVFTVACPISIPHLSFLALFSHFALECQSIDSIKERNTVLSVSLRMVSVLNISNSVMGKYNVLVFLWSDSVDQRLETTLTSCGIHGLESMILMFLQFCIVHERGNLVVKDTLVPLISKRIMKSVLEIPNTWMLSFWLVRNIVSNYPGCNLLRTVVQFKMFHLQNR
jgi:hypothetical protein